MDSSVLHPEVQQFIQANIGVDVSKLALTKNPFPEYDWTQILNQIAAKSKAKDKLPTWFGTENIIYPSKISVEQTSSEKTALYKSTLISGKSLIDLTGGFGVDDYYFSKQVDKVFHCEMNAGLSDIVNHNFGKLQVPNIKCFSGDSAEILKSLHHQFDWIYIDPSRRDEAKGKVFLLKDCLPNVPENLDFYFTFSDQILLKTAPLLDLSAGLYELKNVESIHIVAVKNEVKELLWTLKKDYSGAIVIKAVNLFADSEDVFAFEWNSHSVAHLALPKKYLYEPNAAVMKSGGFNEICEIYQVDKLHPHSHLYTSDELVSFPGRIFEVEQILDYTKAAMKQLPKKANITTRNFPDNVETIRKKWKIADGGNAFCFFTTDTNNNKIVLICTKIQQS